jgi:crossover junction endodeoxyribonuclease RuvC
MIRPLRAIGLDLSLAKTGLAATHSSTGEPRLFTETIHVDRSAKLANIIDHARLRQIYHRIFKAVECRPDIVAIEKPLLVAGKGDTSIRLAELHGLVKCWLFEHNIPYVDIDPNHVKQYATGSGGATKEAVLASMRSHCSALGDRRPFIGDDNAADAMSCLSMVLDALGQPLFTVPEKHRGPLAALKLPQLDVSTAVAR